MNAWIPYIVYIIVVVLSFIILYLLLQHEIAYNVILILFIVSVIGFIAVFLSIAWLDTSTFTDEELILLSTILLITAVIPIILILIMLYLKATSCDNSGDSYGSCKKEICYGPYDDNLCSKGLYDIKNIK